ncbi:antigen peptide transporter 2-like [Syngnathus acus]|uniref:antigen peptide transporter 2-like n=1 Tax=Syngnathus acus TaxID=161584 RepID=UPI001885D1E6|nr:antigen peptide transporter 2-like [Syngnathus acus]XP_037133231.1 antigen peptide transporter 2-like [Syngnathus acus]XP_037133232.1 antigen peptide transporter 2-like [Syngnathus acus]
MSCAVLCGFLLLLLLLLLVDAALTWSLWHGLLGGARVNASGEAAEQWPWAWAAAALKWALLHAVVHAAAAAKNQRAVLGRLATLLVLLPTVLQRGLEPPGLGALLQVALCSGLSCLFWEAGFGGGGGSAPKGQPAPESQPAPDAGLLLARLLRYLRPNQLSLMAAFGVITLAVACDTLVPLLQGTVTDVLRDGALDSAFYSALGALVCFSAGSCLFSGLRSRFFKMAHARLNKRLKVALFRSLLAQEVLFFQENHPGSLCSRLHSDVNKMGLTVGLNANAVLRSSVKTVLMLAAMLYLSRPLTALACIEIPVMAALQRRQVRCHKESNEQKQDSLARLKELSHQSLGGIRSVRSFRGQSDEAQRFHRELGRLRDINVRDGRHKTVFKLLSRFGSLATKVAMLLAARSLVSGGRLSTGTLLTFFLFRKPMSHNLKEIFVCYGDTLATLGIISKVFSYLDRQPKCRPAGQLAPEALRGQVVFRNVTFGYPSVSPEKPALKDVSMVLEAGKVTALVGPSGSGKTSCAGLLKRLYEPQRGDILLDGRPLHAYGNAYLHGKVVAVPQNPVALRGSLRYNVEYGLGPCRTEQLQEAAAKIKAERLLAKLDTAEAHADADEGGAHLSEGEKQSVALLRALLRQPRVLILDEATSQMDVHAQHAVLEEALRCGCTVLMVAHRLNCAERAHRIVFLEDGVVMEQGTHAQLMAKGGRYWQLGKELLDH